MDDEEPLRRHEALKARNRKAQRRYRLKKTQEASDFRSMAENLSLDVALATAQAEELREEKEALKAQLASLNRVTGLQLSPGTSNELVHRGAEGLAAYRVRPGAALQGFPGASFALFGNSSRASTVLQ